MRDIGGCYIGRKSDDVLMIVFIGSLYEFLVKFWVWFDGRKDVEWVIGSFDVGRLCWVDSLRI